MTTLTLIDLPKYSTKAIDLLGFGGEPLDLHFNQTDLYSTHSSLEDLVVLGSLEPRILFVFSKLWELEDLVARSLGGSQDLVRTLQGVECASSL